ncbi:hypothetical protein [Bradyrhizobium sp. USDA 4486]
MGVAFDPVGLPRSRPQLSQSHEFRHRTILRIRTAICGDRRRARRKFVKK